MRLSVLLLFLLLLYATCWAAQPVPKVAPLPLTITTTSLPNGKKGVPYHALICASGGTMPYNWAIIAGKLPAGLSLKPQAPAGRCAVVDGIPK